MSSKFVPSEPASRRDMFLSQLRYLCKAAEHLEKYAGETDEEIPAWVEQQVALSASNIGMAVSYTRKTKRVKS